MSFNQSKIAKQVGGHQSTIYREFKRNMTFVRRSIVYWVYKTLLWKHYAEDRRKISIIFLHLPRFKKRGFPIKGGSCGLRPMSFTSQASPVSPEVYPDRMEDLYSTKSFYTTALYPRPEGNGFTAHSIKSYK